MSNQIHSLSHKPLVHHGFLDFPLSLIGPIILTLNCRPQRLDLYFNPLPLAWICFEFHFQHYNKSQMHRAPPTDSTVRNVTSFIRFYYSIDINITLLYIEEFDPKNKSSTKVYSSLHC